MHDATSHVLHGRVHEPAEPKTMLVVSVGMHILMIVGFVQAPASWWQRPREATQNVMTVSLGPAPGAHSGGSTSIGARSVQKAVETAPRVSVAPKPPQTPLTSTPSEAPRRTPTLGSEVREGRALVETDAQTAGVGLSTGGGGSFDQFEMGNFCCPEYLGMMLQRIRQNWSSRQPTGGVTTIKFTVQRDGMLTDIQVLRSSAQPMLDFLAQRAVLAARQLPPLPAAYPHPTLVVNLDFDYQTSR